MLNNTTERTKGIAITEVRYAIHYATRHEAFWRHVDTLISLVNALAGSAAFSALFSGNGKVSACAGGVVAFLSCVSLVSRPADKAVEFRDYKRQFAALDAVAWDMTLSDIDAKLKVIRQEAPIGFGLLDSVAWNDAMLADGHVGRVRQLTRLERLMALMA